MCGIIHAKNLTADHPVNNLVKIVYQNQKERGQEGFGFVGLSKERIGTYRATDERNIMRYLDAHQYDEIIFHHRLPTSTDNTLKSAHPFVIGIDDRRYYFVHNGVIQNADELKQKHSKKGILYSSQEGSRFNDSEALAWDVCLWLSNRQQKVEAKGSVAFVCLAVSRDSSRAERLYFYRNSRAELKIYRDRALLLLASEGNYAPVKKDLLYFWDYRERQIRRGKPLAIDGAASFSYDYSYLDQELEFEAIINSLKQERDYVLSVGKCDRAEAIDEEIEDLEYQMREKKMRLYLDNF